MTEIKYSKNVIGCNIRGDIYVHPELYKHPRLYLAVLNHERRHSEGLKIKDIVMDLGVKELEGHKKEYYKFILTHPRTLLGLLPLTKVGPHWAFDLEIFAVWVLMIAVGYYIGVNL